MREPWRSHYLSAMGVDLYLPRAPLPGAALSLVPAWDPAALAALTDTAPAPVDAAPAVAADPGGDSATAAPARRVVVELVPPAPAPAPARPRAPAVATPGRPQADADMAPRFALGVVAAGGFLVLDEAPPAGAPQGDYRRLLGNLLFALGGGGGGGAAEVVVEVFSWPLAVRSRQLDRGPDAARQALAFYLGKQLEARGAGRLLLLGETAGRWLPDPDALGVPWARSTSGWHCLREPGAKRALWQELRHLAVAP